MSPENQNILDRLTELESKAIQVQLPSTETENLKNNIFEGLSTLPTGAVQTYLKMIWKNATYYLGVGGSVTSLAKTGDTALTGPVTLTAGSNISLTESGQDITITNTFTSTAKAVDYQTFGTAGSNLWTKPSGTTANSLVYMQMWGGGGGSGGGTNAAGDGGGGGGGEFQEITLLASTLGATVTFTVGAGGTAAAAGNNDGGNGGDSSFPTSVPLIVARGGKFGSKPSVKTGGAGAGYFGGAAATNAGSENSGGGGGTGNSLGVGGAFKGGGGGCGGMSGGGSTAGGVSYFGGNGADSASGNGVGQGGNAPGGGASGARNNGAGGNLAGGIGGAGLVKVWTIF